MAPSTRNTRAQRRRQSPQKSSTTGRTYSRKKTNPRKPKHKSKSEQTPTTSRRNFQETSASRRPEETRAASSLNLQGLEEFPLCWRYSSKTIADAVDLQKRLQNDLEVVIDILKKAALKKMPKFKHILEKAKETKDRRSRLLVLDELRHEIAHGRLAADTQLNVQKLTPREFAIFEYWVASYAWSILGIDWTDMDNFSNDNRIMMDSEAAAILFSHGLFERLEEPESSEEPEFLEEPQSSRRPTSILLFNKVANQPAGNFSHLRCAIRAHPVHTFEGYYPTAATKEAIGSKIKNRKDEMLYVASWATYCPLGLPTRPCRHALDVHCLANKPQLTMQDNTVEYFFVTDVPIKPYQMIDPALDILGNLETETANDLLEKLLEPMKIKHLLSRYFNKNFDIDWLKTSWQAATKDDLDDLALSLRAGAIPSNRIRMNDLSDYEVTLVRVYVLTQPYEISYFVKEVLSVQGDHSIFSTDYFMKELRDLIGDRIQKVYEVSSFFFNSPELWEFCDSLLKQQEVQSLKLLMVMGCLIPLMNLDEVRYGKLFASALRTLKPTHLPLSKIITESKISDESHLKSVRCMLFSANENEEGIPHNWCFETAWNVLKSVWPKLIDGLEKFQGPMHAQSEIWPPSCYPLRAENDWRPAFPCVAVVLSERDTSEVIPPDLLTVPRHWAKANMNLEHILWLRPMHQNVLSACPTKASDSEHFPFTYRKSRKTTSAPEPSKKSFLIHLGPRRSLKLYQDVSEGSFLSLWFEDKNRSSCRFAPPLFDAPLRVPLQHDHRLQDVAKMFVVLRDCDCLILPILREALKEDSQFYPLAKYGDLSDLRLKFARGEVPNADLNRIDSKKMTYLHHWIAFDAWERTATLLERDDILANSPIVKDGRVASNVLLEVLTQFFEPIKQDGNFTGILRSKLTLQPVGNFAQLRCAARADTIETLCGYCRDPATRRKVLTMLKNLDWLRLVTLVAWACTCPHDLPKVPFRQALDIHCTRDEIETTKRLKTKFFLFDKPIKASELLDLVSMDIMKHLDTPFRLIELLQDVLKPDNVKGILDRMLGEGWLGEESWPEYMESCGMYLKMGVIQLPTEYRNCFDFDATAVRLFSNLHSFSSVPYDVKAFVKDILITYRCSYKFPFNFEGFVDKFKQLIDCSRNGATNRELLQYCDERVKAGNEVMLKCRLRMGCFDELKRFKPSLYNQLLTVALYDRVYLPESKISTNEACEKVVSTVQHFWEGPECREDVPLERMRSMCPVLVTALEDIKEGSIPALLEFPCVDELEPPRVEDLELPRVEVFEPPLPFVVVHDAQATGLSQGEAENSNDLDLSTIASDSDETKEEYGGARTNSKDEEDDHEDENGKTTDDCENGYDIDEDWKDDCSNVSVQISAAEQNELNQVGSTEEARETFKDSGEEAKVNDQLVNDLSSTASPERVKVSAMFDTIRTASPCEVGRGKVTTMSDTTRTESRGDRRGEDFSLPTELNNLDYSACTEKVTARTIGMPAIASPKDGAQESSYSHVVSPDEGSPASLSDGGLPEEIKALSSLQISGSSARAAHTFDILRARLEINAASTGEDCLPTAALPARNGGSTSPSLTSATAGYRGNRSASTRSKKRDRDFKTCDGLEPGKARPASGPRLSLPCPTKSLPQDNVSLSPAIGEAGPNSTVDPRESKSDRKRKRSIERRHDSTAKLVRISDTTEVSKQTVRKPPPPVNQIHHLKEQLGPLSSLLRIPPRLKSCSTSEGSAGASGPTKSSYIASKVAKKHDEQQQGVEDEPCEVLFWLNVLRNTCEEKNCKIGDPRTSPFMVGKQFKKKIKLCAEGGWFICLGHLLKNKCAGHCGRLHGPYTLQDIITVAEFAKWDIGL